MTVSIDGTNGLVFNDGSSQASAQVGIKNRLIDAGFIINQRVYVSGTSLASGVYAHDRWKAGSGGCTYTFTQGSLGVPITITITAGSLQQVIEGCNMPEGGTYTLSWSGTAQAKVNGGSYAASPITVTGLTAGNNCTVEFGTGTVTKPQIEVGSTATSFDYRSFGQEEEFCMRYCQAPGIGYWGRQSSTTQVYAPFLLPVKMRSAPTAIFPSTTGSVFSSGSSSITSISLNGSSTTYAQWVIGMNTLGATGYAVDVALNSSPLLLSEL
jgi:hypothetical protein